MLDTVYGNIQIGASEFPVDVLQRESAHLVCAVDI